jgi:phosphate transport system ATP-binding protein
MPKGKDDMPTAANPKNRQIKSVVSLTRKTNRTAEQAKPDCNAVIKAENFSFYYGSTVGVKDITMDIYPRSVTAIIGPSGCGKSTFLRSINRINDLIPHTRTQGGLLVNGHNVYDKNTNLANLRQQVGMVFQKPNPFPKSIFDNVAYGPILQGVKNRSQLQQIVENSLKSAALKNPH